MMRILLLIAHVDWSSYHQLGIDHCERELQITLCYCAAGCSIGISYKVFNGLGFVHKLINFTLRYVSITGKHHRSILCHCVSEHVLMSEPIRVFNTTCVGDEYCVTKRRVRRSTIIMYSVSEFCIHS